MKTETQKHLPRKVRFVERIYDDRKERRKYAPMKSSLVRVVDGVELVVAMQVVSRFAPGWFRTHHRHEGVQVLIPSQREDGVIVRCKTCAGADGWVLRIDRDDWDRAMKLLEAQR